MPRSIFVYQAVHWVSDGVEFDGLGFFSRENAAARVAELNRDRAGESFWELSETEVVDSLPVGAAAEEAV